MEKLYLSCHPTEAGACLAGFEAAFGHLFDARPGRSGDLDSASASAYIETIRRLGLIDAVTVVVVLVSRNSRASRRIDWEIAAALSADGAGRGAAALFAIMLPDLPRRRPRAAEGSAAPFFEYQTMPPRLADNVRSGYARIYDWNWLCADEARVATALVAARARQRQATRLIDNRRRLLTNDLPTPAADLGGSRERRRQA